MLEEDFETVRGSRMNRLIRALWKGTAAAAFAIAVVSIPICLVQSLFWLAPRVRSIPLACQYCIGAVCLWFFAVVLCYVRRK